MYTIINRGYGILLSDGYKLIGENNTSINDFLDDYAKLVDKDNVYKDTWSFKDKVFYLSEMDLLNGMYSGQNDFSIAYFGVCKFDWPTSDLSGPNGIIEFAKKNNPTKSELKEYENIPLEFRELFEKHCIEPEIFWVESTS